MFWEHSIAPQKRQRTGCFRSSSADRGHLKKEENIQYGEDITSLAALQQRKPLQHKNI